MGNYIYGRIVPMRMSGNQSTTLDIKPVVKVVTNEVVTNEVVTNEVVTNEVVSNEVETISTIKEDKLIHPYLLEYGTHATNHMIINNNIYAYKK